MQLHTNVDHPRYKKLGHLKIVILNSKKQWERKLKIQQSQRIASCEEEIQMLVRSSVIFQTNENMIVIMTILLHKIELSG
jgi:hypothetical protein